MASNLEAGGSSSEKKQVEASSSGKKSEKVDYAELHLRRKLSQLARENEHKKKLQGQIASVKKQLEQTSKRTSYLTEEIQLKREAYESMVLELGHRDTECMESIKTIAQLKVEVEKKRFLGLLGDNDTSFDKMVPKAAEEALGMTLREMDVEQFQKYILMTDEQRAEAILGKRHQQLRTIVIRNVSATKDSLSERNIQRRFNASDGLTFGGVLAESLRFWGLDGPQKEVARRKSFREQYRKKTREFESRAQKDLSEGNELEEHIQSLQQLVLEFSQGSRTLEDDIPTTLLNAWSSNVALAESASEDDHTSFEAAMEAKRKWESQIFLGAINDSIISCTARLNNLRNTARASADRDEEILSELRKDAAMVHLDDDDLKDRTEYALCDSAGALRLAHSLVSNDNDDLVGEQTELSYNLFALPKLNIKSVFDFSAEEYALDQRGKAELQRKAAAIANGEEDKTGPDMPRSIFDNWTRHDLNKILSTQSTQAGQLKSDPVLSDNNLLIKDLLMFLGLLFVWSLMIYAQRSVASDAQTSILGSHWLAERRLNSSGRPWDYDMTLERITTTEQWWNWMQGPLLLTISRGKGMRQAADFSGNGLFYAPPIRKICASHNKPCECPGGRVRFGDPDLQQWTDWKILGENVSTIVCSSQNFKDSLNGEASKCECETPSDNGGNSTLDISAANVGGAYRLFGGWRIRQIRIQENCGNLGGSNSKTVSAAIKGKQIQSQNNKTIQNFYGDFSLWGDCESTDPFGPLNQPTGCDGCIEYKGIKRSLGRASDIPKIEDASTDYATYNPLSSKSVFSPPIIDDDSGKAIFRSFLHIPGPTSLQRTRAQFGLGKTFTSEDYFDSAEIYGKLHTYSSGGYVMDISATNLTAAEARYRLAMLRHYGWIDAQTRCVSARANFYNANLGAWLIVEATAEWESTGVVVASFKSSLVIPDIYDTPRGKLAGLLAAVLLILLSHEFYLQTLYWKSAKRYILECETPDTIKQRRKRCAVTRLWLSSMWTWIELGIIIPCLFARIMEVLIFSSDKRYFPVSTTI